MGQFNFKPRDRAAHTTSHPEWLSVSAAVGRMVNTWSDRVDVAALVAPDAGDGHPAFFDPTSSEVEVNVQRCFGKDVLPTDVATLDDRATQYEWPRATGAIFHEALHARFSRWSLPDAQRDLDKDAFQALVMLEEGRIEAQGLKLFPRNAPFLRSCALEIVMDSFNDFAGSADTELAATMAALVLARVDAGSIAEEDAESLRDAIVAKISDETLAAMRSVWCRFQEVSDVRDVSTIYDLAKEWSTLVKAQAEENGDARGGTSGGLPSEFMDAIKDALGESADMAGIAAAGELADMETLDSWETEVSARSSESRERKDATDVSSDVFGKGTMDLHGTGSYSVLRERRQPTGAERAAAVVVSRMLDKAKYRDRDATEITSIVPPGRLRTRAAMQGVAQRSKGVITSVEPWRRTVRKHTDDPTLSVGVMVDISGSMADAMEPMAVSAWVLSEAARRVQARTAMVYYGNDVFPTLKPGQHLDEVRVWSAPDHTEKFGKAFKAVNGALNLTWGTGARLLVVVSDGAYTDQEEKAARAAIAQCARGGVGVLWLDMDPRGSWQAQRLTNGTHAVLVKVDHKPATAATAIGQAAARALTAVA